MTRVTLPVSTFVDFSESVDTFLRDIARVSTTMGEPAAPSVVEGLSIAARYRLLRPLGRGAHGVVWVAVDEVARNEVAVKLLRPASPASSVRIRAEVGAMRNLRALGAVRLLDEGLDGGIVFIVMPLVSGEPFPGSALPVTWEELEPRALRLLETLADVHSSGIVHRDLKPANVLVTGGGDPVVLDFGLSLPAFLTRPGAIDQVLGTPAYLAPEQIGRGEVDARADLYAVGAMLFEALTGRRPHIAPNVRALLAAKFEPPPPIGQIVASLPPHVARTIDALLATHVWDRPSSATEVIDSLRESAVKTASQPWPDLLSSDPDASLTKAELVSLFVDAGPFSSVSEDAAELLACNTSGRAADVRTHLERWLRDHVCRWVAAPGSKLVVDRFALDALEARRRLSAARGSGAPIQEVGCRVARELAAEGRLGLAAAVLQITLWELHPVDAGEADELLSVAVEVALADGEPRALDRVLYELCRAGPGSPHARHLEGLVRAALAVGPWTERALDLASDLEPFAQVELELLRQSIRVHAARRASMDRESEVLSELAAWATATADPVVRGTYAGWLGRLRYREGRYHEAAEQHRVAAAAPLWRAAQAAALVNAASALMEAFRLEEAMDLAETARRFFETCRHAAGRIQATWFARTIAYRRGDALDPDDAWIDWIAARGMREFEGLASVTEAAIAWRSGDRARGRALAHRAEQAWTVMGETAGARLLAMALGVTCSPPGSVPAESIAALERGAVACPTPGVGIQVLALIAEHRETPVEADVEEALSAQVPAEHWPCRIDVLSVEEARAALERARMKK